MKIGKRAGRKSYLYGVTTRNKFLSSYSLILLTGGTNKYLQTQNKALKLYYVCKMKAIGINAMVLLLLLQ